MRYQKLGLNTNAVIDISLELQGHIASRYFYCIDATILRGILTTLQFSIERINTRHAKSSSLRDYNKIGQQIIFVQKEVLALLHIILHDHLRYGSLSLSHTCYQNVMNLRACKVCNEGMVEDECHLLFTCSAYSAIRSRYDDILRGSDNLSVILKTPPRRLSSYVYVLKFTHRDFVLQFVITPFQEGDTYQEHMYIMVPQDKTNPFVDDKSSNSNSNCTIEAIS